jgi:chromate transport protein ChrA
MRYVKSVLTGLSALFLAAFVFTVIQFYRVLQIARRENPGAAEVGVDIVALFKTPRFWIIVVLAFALGFWWQYRKASSRS